MKLPSRSRLLTLVAFGALLLAVVGLKLRGTFRGVSYYFPTWRWSSESGSAYAERLKELTDLHRSLPIVLAAWERKHSIVGIKWEEMREKLPEFLQDQLPEYASSRDTALDWLSSHAQEIEVARAITNRWFHWDRSDRMIWLMWQGAAMLTNRIEYLPLLSAEVQSTNSFEALSAAWLLTAYRPLTTDHAELIAWAMTNHSYYYPSQEFGGANFERKFALAFTTLHPPPPPIMAALQAWTASTNPERAAIAALTLARIDSGEFPPETVLEPVWRQLSPNELGRFLTLLENPAFRPVTTSSWSVGILKELLTMELGTNRPRTVLSAPPVRTVLRILGELDPTAAGTTPALLPLLSHTNSQISRAAARAFAAVAPATAEFVPAISPHLTNQATAASLLLWLSTLGTNAAPARDDMERIATEAVLFPESVRVPSFMLDPILARRYGLIPNTAAASRPNVSSPTNQVTWQKPSKIMVEAQANCPRRLLRFWPGFRDELTIKTGMMEGETPLLRLRAPLPDASLATLARHCLSNLTADFQPTAAE